MALSLLQSGKRNLHVSSHRRCVHTHTHTHTKITFAALRAAVVPGILIYCSDYRCSHSIAVIADGWPDDARLSDIEPRFVCTVCGKRGADVRPRLADCCAHQLWKQAP